MDGHAGMTDRADDIARRVGLELFSCERLRARLTRQDCARRHRRAETDEFFPSLDLCRRCPIGAAHREQYGVARAKKRRIGGRDVAERRCTRCGTAFLPRFVRQHACSGCLHRAHVKKRVPE